jgi:hypothetical protein
VFLIRCSKCGAHSGFVVMRKGFEDLPVEGRLKPEHVKVDPNDPKDKVRIACNYCHIRWWYPPDQPSPPKPQAKPKRFWSGS